MEEGNSSVLRVTVLNARPDYTTGAPVGVEQTRFSIKLIGREPYNYGLEFESLSFAIAVSDLPAHFHSKCESQITIERLKELWSETLLPKTHL